MKPEELELIKQLKNLGWRFAYVSGHGDSEYVFDYVGDKYLAVGDVEKTMYSFHLAVYLKNHSTHSYTNIWTSKRYSMRKKY